MLTMLIASSLAAPVFSPVGPESRGIADLGSIVLMTFGAVSVVMWVLIAWVALRRRGTLAEHAPWDAAGDKRWMLFGGFAIPAIILATIFGLTLRTMSAYPMQYDEMHGAPPALTITGHQWWWEVTYQLGDVHQHVPVANEIHIPTGEQVDIELRTADVIHSFWIPQLHGKVDLVPGQVNRIRIQADQPGVYRGQCAEYCGAQHAHMMLIVKAEPRAEFAQWLARQRQDAAAPADALARRGHDVFMANACVLCHQVRGTSAHGLVGPDLTHLGSRLGIAANAFPNSRAYLSAWVTHAQSLKPGVRMPDVTAFNGDDLRALVAYLEELQ